MLLPEATLRTVTLAGPTDLEGFRRACRRLLADGVSPEGVEWRVGDRIDAELFDAAPSTPDTLDCRDGSETPPREAPPIPVPPAFLALCESVVLHRDPGRFHLLHRLLWRYTREPGLRHDVLDADRIAADRMARAVHRDLHKMKAFVRFRPVLPVGADAHGHVEDTEVRHVAWFEPEHHIVEAVAPFFARRFAQMRWAILTPERSVRWNGAALEFAPGAKREDAPSADAGEALWLTYYRNIFNPARLKLATMQREMPRRYWPNLPEAGCIETLAAAATSRRDAMIDHGPTDPVRRRPRAAAKTEPNPPEPSSERPSSLADLAQALDRCRECPLGALATQAVPGAGPQRGARLMFVGEQPGDREDLRGEPFVGPAGQLLDRAFAELGWPRSAAYVTNAVKHFKYELRGKRRIHKTPAQQEAAACLHWLESEIGLVRPDAIVALGATAARQLLGKPVAVMRQRGEWLERSDGLRVLITLHPSALLRGDPAELASAFESWLADLRQADRYFDPPARSTS